MKFQFREDRPECDNCGSEAETCLSEWGPPYTEKHEYPQQALCAYCYNVAGMEYPESRQLAQMMNVLEGRLRSFLAQGKNDAAT